MDAGHQRYTIVDPPFGGNIRFIANPKYPPIVHPLDTTSLEALLGEVLRRYGADAHHIYVVGFSSGAWMASDLAQFAQRRIAAVAIVGYVGMSRAHRISYPVSSFLIFGKQDFSGRPSPAQWSTMPPIAKEKWYGQDTLPTLDEDLRALGAGGWLLIQQSNDDPLGEPC